MSIEQATQVVRYLLKLIDDRVRYDLHVHCIGGQARSVAIAYWAAWLQNLDRKHIKTNNPKNPNPHVTEMLDKAYRQVLRTGAVQ